MIQKFNTIILVIALDTEVLRQFKKIWLEYYNLFPEIKIHFVYGDSLTTGPHPNDLHFPYIKEYVNKNSTKLQREHSMLEKTLDAFRTIDQIYDYQFVIRTTLPTFWDLEKQLLLMKNFPKKKFAIGTLRNIILGPNQISENFISGTDITITRDLVKNFIIDKPYLMTKTFSEDLSISHYIKHDLGIELQEFIPKTQAIMENYTTYNPETFEQSLNKYKNLYITHYRIKNKDRINVDLPIANHLLKKIYNKSIT